ncbi:metallophosphoesterase [Rhizomonospora bruguierae]|uniref:metallophosphoesterase n=1 Tax=Rhizomonospora bruguierae TaxID=1581705 RepID=UPI001BCDCC71|nr:metallophosphoesterase [Micromonospora sp. NBRC 107566]
MIIGFLATAVLVVVLIHLYLWKRLVRDTIRPGRWRRVAGLAVLVGGLLVPATLVGTRAGAGWLAWPGFIWLALMFYLLVSLLVLEIPMLVARLLLRRRARRATPAVPVSSGVPGDVSLAGVAAGPRNGAAKAAVAEQAPPVLAEPSVPAEPPVPGAVPRRVVLSRGAAIMAGLAATGTVGYGVRTAMGPPRLNRVQIPLAKLPRSMDGLRVALVSDIHLGPLAGRAHTERIVEKINSLDADLVTVVGDLVDGTVAELGPAAEPLGALRSRRGAFFVTGNHEYYSGAAEWVEEVGRLGLRVLRNERVEIAGLDLAGVNDATGGEQGDPPDYDRALAGRDPSRPVVLMAHQPVQAHEAARRGVDLQLSGHTHGGQLAPFNLLVKLQQPVVSGLGRVDGMPVFVTNGAGFWGPPVRVGAPPQVTLVELRSTR